jgi:hypothetical protein
MTASLDEQGRVGLSCEAYVVAVAFALYLGRLSCNVMGLPMFGSDPRITKVSYALKTRFADRIKLKTLAVDVNRRLDTRS